MGSLYAKNVVETALNEIGYQADGKMNKYAAELDAVDYFVGCGKKNGLDWCCVFVCWLAYHNCIPEPDKWDAMYFLFQDQKCNTSAVVKYAADFYKQNNAFYTDTSKFERGDQIFFKKGKNTLYHTGLIVDWDEKGIYTVEGNTNGGQVAKKFYAYDEAKIAGVGRPRYDGWEPKKAEVKPEPVKVNDGSEYTEAEIKAAYDCYEGYYGNGMTRKNNLIQAGFSYVRVQGLVNKIVHGEFKR